MKDGISASDLTVSYYGNNVLNGISFEFEKGKMIGILGPNGAGKSTMIKAMLGLIPKDRGTTLIDDLPLNNARKRIAYVPQRSNIDWDFPIIVKDAVLLGTYPKLGLFKRPGKAEKEHAMHCLEKVGMQDFSRNQIGELSGGQQQRVFLARALAQNAEYFFLDEPFVGIDVTSEKIIINILHGLRNEGKTIFVVHHDLSKVENYFDSLLLVNKKLIGAGDVEEIFQPKYMEEAYNMPFGGQMLGVGS